MTPDEFRAALARLGLTQSGAARLLGVDARTVRKWACDERGVPEPVRRLLWLCERHPAVVADLAEAATDHASLAT
jgi:DNA-binding transcriptional regulator YiaG